MHPFAVVLVIVGGLYGLYTLLQGEPTAAPAVVKERCGYPPILGRTVRIRDTLHARTIGAVGMEGSVVHRSAEDFWMVRIDAPRPFTVKLKLEDMELPRPLAVVAPGTSTSGDILCQLLSSLSRFDIDRHFTTMTTTDIVDHLAELMEWPETRPAVLVLNLFLTDSVDSTLDMISYLRRAYSDLYIVVWTKQPARVRQMAIESGASAAFNKYVEDGEMLEAIAAEISHRQG